jgi:multidrug efflux pump subunit AcrB
MATMLVAALVAFGIIGYQRLPVREFPDIDPPVVSVVTVYRGANPEVVETEVTEVLEEELNTIEFELRRNVDIAAQDVRDKIARVRGRLPDEVGKTLWIAGALVQLSNLVEVTPTIGPREINHYNRVRSSTLSANLAPGMTLDKALNAMQTVANQTLPPAGREICSA